jgi:5-methyltetrahydrofolate--homocysteine methyltransferase
MGTELQRAGIRPGECYELWNLTHPEAVAAVHRAYADAGAVCLITNTFQANLASLARHGLESQLEEIIRAGIELARAAAEPERFVLADVGPVDQPADQLAPALAALSGADGILVETCSDLEVAEAVLASVCGAVPVLLSLTYLRDDTGQLRTYRGLSPEEGARRAAALGVAALGVNCGREIGVEDCAEILRRYRAVTTLPLLARPNAGTPTKDRERLVYPRGPQEMTAGLPALLVAGAALVGGCCGTTPAHIGAFRAALSGA